MKKNNCNCKFLKRLWIEDEETGTEEFVYTCDNPDCSDYHVFALETSLICNEDCCAYFCPN